MDKTTDKKTIMFVCTANSCRSQIAEGWGELLLGEKFNVFSAGVSPARISGSTIEVMKEVGVDISGHYAKHIDELCGIEFDYVVTLCNYAHSVCPEFGESTKIIHHPVSMGNDLREIRDEIKRYIDTLPELLGNV